MKTKKRFIILVILLIILDQVTKFLFQGKTYLINEIGIEYATNTGAAFGLLQGNNILLALLSLIIILFVFFYSQKAKGYQQIGFLFILSGATGNLLDRLVLGYVRDFIAVYWWPNFNLADSYNVIGILLLILAELNDKKP